MHPNRGNFSLVFLVGVFFLVIFAQIALIHIKHDYLQTVSYSKNLQQRYLTQSIAQWMITNSTSGIEIDTLIPLNQGKTSIAIKTATDISNDGCFEKTSITSILEESKHQLCRWRFLPTIEQQTLGTQYMFITKRPITGVENLSEGTLYTSTGSFSLPQIRFLNGKAHSNLNSSTVQEYGFDGNFNYMTSKVTLTNSKTAKAKGNLLLACTNSVIVSKYFSAPDRLIIIANGNVEIGDDVNLGKALIMTNNNVKIGRNVSINGVIFCGGTITINGKGKFTHDASAVASFASPFYIA